MIYRLSIWKLETRMCLVDLLKVGLEKATCDTAAKHGSGQTFNTDRGFVWICKLGDGVRAQIELDYYRIGVTVGYAVGKSSNDEEGSSRISMSWERSKAELSYKGPSQVSGRETLQGGLCTLSCAHTPQTHRHDK